MFCVVFDQLIEFEENIFYDVFGWILLLVYDFEFLFFNMMNVGMLGDFVMVGLLVQFVLLEFSYGYILCWLDYYVLCLFYCLLDEDLCVCVVIQVMMINMYEGLVEFGLGIVFVFFQGQDVSCEYIYQLVSMIVEEDGVVVYFVVFGFMFDNIFDLGDGVGFCVVDWFEVFVFFEDGFLCYDIGEVWYQFDYCMYMFVILCCKSDLGGIDWFCYIYLIIVGGNVDLGSVQECVEQWVCEEGGMIIVMCFFVCCVQCDFLMGDGVCVSVLGNDCNVVLDCCDYLWMVMDDVEYVIGGVIFEGDFDVFYLIGFGYLDCFIFLYCNIMLMFECLMWDLFVVVVEYVDDLLLVGYVL